ERNMLEITERSERASLPTLGRARRTASSSCQALRSIRSKQTSAMWLLSILGLVPVVALVLAPEGGHQLPHDVQWAGYLASLMLLGAACFLIINPGDEHTSGCQHDSADF